MYKYNTMKKILTLTLFVLSIHFCFGQLFEDTVAYDRMEVYDWSGNWWVNGSNVGFASNISISAPASAYFYGVGNSNSKSESNWYVLPSIDTLRANEEHKVKFHFASPRVTSTGPTSGIDLDDYIDIQVSIDGGVTYSSEVRVTGNNNAYWGYNNKTITKVINGTLDTYTPAGGGDRTLAGDGYSIVELIFPLGVTQIAIDVYVQANSNGEEFWMDDFFLLGSGGGTSLPIVLTSFNAEEEGGNVVVDWVVHSQVNNDYYTIEKSDNCFDWLEVGIIKGAGNSNTQMNYRLIDINPFIGLSYYRLKQTDYDGRFEVFRPVSISVKDEKTIGLNIHPNPAIEYIELNLEYTQDHLINHNVQIYDINGNKVYKKHFIGELSNFKINIQKFKPGIYLVKSKSDNIKGEGKFIKKDE